jgi:hypothetical protein
VTELTLIHTAMNLDVLLDALPVVAVDPADADGWARPVVAYLAAYHRYVGAQPLTARRRAELRESLADVLLKGAPPQVVALALRPQLARRAGA